MLIVFPLFASVDETTNKFEALQEKVKTTPTGQRKSHAKAAEKIFEDYQQALISILKQRPRLAKNDAHPDFLRALDHNTGILLCKLIGFNTVGLIATVQGDVNNSKCELYELKKRAFDAGLNQSSLKCLPKSEDQLKKPQGCH